MDSYCQLGCNDAMFLPPCDGPMVARFSGPGNDSWHCYSPSALESNQTYDGRSQCYCPRQAELTRVRAICSEGIQAVFSPKMDGSACYRIPALIHLPTGGPGTLLAFSEQRLYSCSDSSHSNIVLRRSLDGGESWEPTIITVAIGDGNALSNANPVLVTFPNGTRAVLLHYDTMNNPTSVTRGRNLQRWSLDAGLTWTEPVDITEFMPEAYAGCMPGPSSGIFNAERGRIYFSCHGFRRRMFLYWSDDWGRSWQHSAVYGMDECAIAPLANGSVAMSCRTGQKWRAQLTWSESGELHSPIMRPQGLIDPNCQGSLASVRLATNRSPQGFVDHLYLSNDNTTSGRSHMTIKRSVDGGASWNSGHLVWAGLSGYSQLAIWDHEDGSGRHWIGLLFELGLTFYVESLGFRKWVLEEHGGPGAAHDAHLYA